ncbi:hypothetical protein SY83_02970 [Paenibacillus swuensis]|uniref:YtkA-like domain-containing protein n=1 Tax=Paenibacillus swuensis TaxID=1178515 RepID=A0A172TEX0_9BACL|nr:hypothetical protein [Paenibacillus swuensis]ANE45454.1 hypothetical protein SY83_02970 [Paenibacillus swuensis]
MRRIAILMFISIAILAACGKSEDGSGTGHGGHGTEETNAGHGAEGTHGADDAKTGHQAEEAKTGNGADGKNAGHGNHTERTQSPADEHKVHAVWKLSASSPKPQEELTLTIELRDHEEKAIEQFDINHEKKMHLIVVSEDLSYFDHIHPEYKEAGTFEVTTKLPAAGKYKVIADFIPTGMGSMTQTEWITVAGEAPQQKAMEPESELTKVVNGKEIALNIDHLMAGMDANLSFHIRRADDQTPVSDLEPYLGAVGHVVILSADTEQYLHVHPTDERATGPEANFATSFPKSGVYKIWGQFQHQGEVFVVPFVVEVP